MVVAKLIKRSPSGIIEYLERHGIDASAWTSLNCQWLGDLSKGFGLYGQAATQEALDRLVAFCSPLTGEALPRGPGRAPAQFMYEFGVEFEKEISLAWASFPDRQARTFLNIVGMAVARAFKEIVAEQYARVRRDAGGRDWEKPDLAYFCKLHVENRDGQPHLNAHVGLPRVARSRFDGTFLTLNDLMLHRAQAPLRDRVNDHVKRGLRRVLHLGVARQGKRLRVAGVKPEAVKAFSGPSQKIAEKTREWGNNSHRARSAARYATRSPKQPSGLFADWLAGVRERLRAFGQTNDGLFARGRAYFERRNARRLVREVAEDFSSRGVFPSSLQVYKEAVARAEAAGVGRKALRRAAADFVARPERYGFVEAEDRRGRTVYISKEHDRAERSVEKSLKDLSRQNRHEVTASRVNAVLRSRPGTSERLRDEVYSLTRRGLGEPSLSGKQAKRAVALAAEVYARESRSHRVITAGTDRLAARRLAGQVKAQDFTLYELARSLRRHTWLETFWQLRRHSYRSLGEFLRAAEILRRPTLKLDKKTCLILDARGADARDIAAILERAGKAKVIVHGLEQERFLRPLQRPARARARQEEMKSTRGSKQERPEQAQQAHRPGQDRTEAGGRGTGRHGARPSQKTAEQGGRHRGRRPGADGHQAPTRHPSGEQQPNRNRSAGPVRERGPRRQRQGSPAGPKQEDQRPTAGPTRDLRREADHQGNESARPATKPGGLAEAPVAGNGAGQPRQPTPTAAQREPGVATAAGTQPFAALVSCDRGGPAADDTGTQAHRQGADAQGNGTKPASAPAERPPTQDLHQERTR